MNCFSGFLSFTRRCVCSAFRCLVERFSEISLNFIRSLLLSHTNWAVICVLLIDLFEFLLCFCAYSRELLADHNCFFIKKTFSHHFILWFITLFFSFCFSFIEFYLCLFRYIYFLSSSCIFLSRAFFSLSFLVIKSHDDD